MPFDTRRLPRDWRPQIASKAGVSCEYLSRVKHGRVNCSLETAIRIIVELQRLGGDASIEEVMNLTMPVPASVRLRECDPVLTAQQLVDLERKQLALLGYSGPYGDDDPPPATPAGRPPPDPRQIDLEDFLSEQTSAAGGRQRRVRTA